MNTTRYIYTLSCPISGEIRYVGQTNNIQRRLSKHITTSHTNPKTHCQCWIKGLIKKGYKPIIEEVTVCNVNEVDGEERFYISMFRYWGFDITNLESGGTNLKEVSEHTKIKIKQILTGRKQSHETKIKRSITNKEVWKDEKLREGQRKRALELNRLGLIGTKGRPSKKKGKPFAGDKNKISSSLKEYYRYRAHPNKKYVTDIQAVINDYLNESITLNEVAAKYKVDRRSVTNAMKDNGIPLRNNGRKNISMDQLIEMRLINRMSVKDIASQLKCSNSNVEKFIKKYKVYLKKDTNEIDLG
jgi:predicted DNA-binding protein YlxM (UPF0122 family)